MPRSREYSSDSDDDTPMPKRRRVVKKKVVMKEEEKVAAVDIVLDSDQTEHFAKIQAWLTGQLPLFYDFSDLGLGKTVIAIAIAMSFNLPMFVVCPLTTAPNWELECNKYGATIDRVCGHDSLRGQKNKTLKHGLLTREEAPTQDVQKARRDKGLPSLEDGESSDVRFHVTDKLKALVQRGILCCLDECQSVKNDSDQNRAVGAIAQYIVGLGVNGSPSKVMMLSGSAFNKEIHCSNLLRCSGLISEKAYSYDRTEKHFLLDGAKQLLDLCQRLDPDKFRRMSSPGGIFQSKPHVENHIFLLFINILKNHMSNAMPIIQLKVKLDCKSGYYRQEQKEVDILKDAIRGLRAASCHRPGEKIELGALNKAMQYVELCKVDIPVRLGRRDLTASSKCKIIFMCWYHDTIDVLASAFAQWEPLLLTGKVKDIKERARIMARFNEDGDDSPRVLISMCSVTSTGVNLQDLTGNRPRIQYVFPSYNFIHLHQAIKRTYRRGAASDVVVRFLYGESTEETSLLNSLSRSSDVLKQLNSRADTKERILTLMEYPVYKETAVEFRIMCPVKAEVEAVKAEGEMVKAEGEVVKTEEEVVKAEGEVVKAEVVKAEVVKAEVVKAEVGVVNMETHEMPPLEMA